MSSKVDIQRNKFMHLEDMLVMYGVYNTETLEKLIKTVHTLHSRQSMYKSLFTGQITKAYQYYSQMHGDHGIQQYAINSMLYLRAIKDKKAHGFKGQPLKDFILGSSPSVNRKLLTHILTNVNTHPPTQKL